VRQTFSDRAGDEVDASETIREKTSLSDRFGLKVAYLPLTRAEFLAMVERMARHKGIEMESEQLKAEAVKWEAFHHGRTPRTAKQFLASLNT
jgi:predicted AAA+ superfamily ATPase